MNNSLIPSGYLRVTQVLEPYTKFDKIDPEVLKKAADRGTRAHTFCTMYALNMLIVDVDHDCKGYVDSFIEWYDKTVEKTLMASERINHAEYKISGEFDLICLLKGDYEPTLIDIKTPASESPTWQLQTAAYKILLEDVKDFSVSRRIALMLPKDGSKAKVVEYLDHEEDEKLYLSALRLYRFFNS